MEGKPPHVLALPYPAEGHINPMMQLAKCLASKGLRVTLILATSTSMCAQTFDTGLLNLEYISDGSDEGKVHTLEAYFERMEAAVCKNVARLIEKLDKSNFPAKVLVYDSTFPRALEVAHRLGLRGASFFTQSCAVNLIYYFMKKGELKFPLEQSTVSIPPLPLLEANDLPFSSHVKDSNQALMKYFTKQFSNVQNADWILFNTIDKLESGVVSWMKRQWPIKTIGPTILQDKKSHRNHKISDCIKWLNRREMRSVVYVSFGTVAELGEEQMEEIARGLVSSDCYFLWIVRTSEESKLPTNFRSEVSEKDLILSWCPQLDVLSNQAVACFMTHCGWNSTLEALSSSVAVIAMPHMVDQMTNAKFISDVWRTGTRVKANEKGIVTREEIEKRIREVTQSEMGKELKTNVDKLKQEIQEAIAEGGSSYKNMEDFLSQLSSI